MWLTNNLNLQNEGATQSPERLMRRGLEEVGDLVDRKLSRTPTQVSQRIILSDEGTR